MLGNNDKGSAFQMFVEVYVWIDLNWPQVILKDTLNSL